MSIKVLESGRARRGLAAWVEALEEKKNQPGVLSPEDAMVWDQAALPLQ